MQVFFFRNRPNNTSFHFCQQNCVCMCEPIWELVILIKTLAYILWCISVTGTHDADKLAGATFAMPNVLGPRCWEIWFSQSENELNTMNWAFINPWNIRNYGGLVLKWVWLTPLKVRPGGVLWAYTQGMTHDGKENIYKLASLGYLTTQKV